jgi:hypothetical protein
VGDFTMIATGARYNVIAKVSCSWHIFLTISQLVKASLTCCGIAVADLLVMQCRHN